MSKPDEKSPTEHPQTGESSSLSADHALSRYMERRANPRYSAKEQKYTACQIIYNLAHSLTQALKLAEIRGDLTIEDTPEMLRFFLYSDTIALHFSLILTKLHKELLEEKDATT